MRNRYIVRDKKIKTALGKRLYKVKEVKQMYKMEVYRAEEKTLFRTEKSNNLEYFDRYKNRTNYKIKIFQKVKNKWNLIYSEV